jgi:hypothetical protein
LILCFAAFEETVLAYLIERYVFYNGDRTAEDAGFRRRLQNQGGIHTDFAIASKVLVKLLRGIEEEGLVFRKGRKSKHVFPGKKIIARDGKTFDLKARKAEIKAKKNGFQQKKET